jgi:hypothetical protein
LSVIDSLITNRTGGFYNASDLNRVAEAVEYVNNRLTAAGFNITVTAKRSWSAGDIPTVAQMTAYLADITKMRGAIAMLSTTPSVPSDMDNLTVEEANDIERILRDVDELITSMTGVTLCAPIHTASGARLRLPEQLLELRDSDGYWLLDADGKQLEARCV